MKKHIVYIIFFVLIAQLHAQEAVIEKSEYSKVRFAFTFGITPMNPDQINQHIGESNYALGSEAKSIKSLPEFGATVTLRPMNDAKIIILRAGFANSERIFNFSMDQTSSNDSPIGKLEGSITETYAFYPLAFGVGAATANNDLQFQAEFIYGLSYVTEEGTFRTTNGTSSTYLHEFFSPAYGLRVAGNSTVAFSENVGLLMELSYRYLVFDEYEDNKSLPVHFFEFPISGITASAGISVKL